MPYIGNIVQDFSVNTAMLNTDSVTSIKIDDGTIVNADINDSAAIAMSKLALSITNSEINASAAIAGTKIAPNFGSQNTTTTGIAAVGELQVTSTAPKITFFDSDTNPDFEIRNLNGVLHFKDVSSTAVRMQINTDGHVDILGNLDVGAGVDVTGAITGTGDLTIDTNTLHVDSSNNRVGIGTTSPTAELEIFHATDPEIHLNINTHGDVGIIRGDADGLTLTGNGSSDQIRFKTNDTERMRIDASGRLLIGTTTAAALLTLDNTGQTSQSLIQCEDVGGSGAHAHIVLKNTTGTVGTINTVSDNLEFRVDDATVFSNISGTEHMRISSSGNVGIGLTTPGHLLHLMKAMSSSPSLIEISVSGSNTVGGGGGISFDTSASNTDANVFRAQILGIRNSLDNGSNDLVFLTTTNAVSGSNPIEKVRIKNDGKVGINETDPLARLHVKNGESNAAGYAHDTVVVEDSDHAFVTLLSGTSGSGGINFGDAGDPQRGVIQYDHGSDYMRFITAAAERMRIDSAGVIRIGHTSYTASAHSDDLIVGAQNSGHNRGITILNHTGQDGAIGFAEASGSNAGMIKYSHGSNVLQFFVEAEEMVRLDNTSVQNTAAMQLRKPQAASNVQSHMIHLIVGGHDRGALIAGSSFGASAIVGATSDYRVKTNIRNYTGGWDNIKALPVKIFDINKEGEEATDIKGWIAHEVQAVIPEAVSGAKDAKKADGSDDYQSLGYNVFMPDVVGALQTAMAKIETLEAKVAALEAA